MITRIRCYLVLGPTEQFLLFRAQGYHKASQVSFRGRLQACVRLPGRRYAGGHPDRRRVVVILIGMKATLKTDILWYLDQDTEY
jgi:hypothetical protein